jgi:Domain of unknown function (DUF4157)
MLRAKAFTIGKDVFFGRSQYEPSHTRGRRLLAHELVHTVQQRDVEAATPMAALEVGKAGDPFEQEADMMANLVVSAASPLHPTAGDSGIQTTGFRHCDRLAIQRAEIDDDPKNCFPPGGTALTDSRSTINSWVAGARVGSEKDGLHITAAVFKAMAAGGSVTPVEKKLEALPATQVRHVDYAKSRYAGTMMWPVDPITRTGLWAAGKIFVAPVINLCGVCVGTDKVGHFFQQGYEYFRLGQELRSRVETMTREEQKQMLARLSGPPLPSLFNRSADIDVKPVEFELSDYTELIVGAFTMEFGKWLEGFTQRLSNDDIKWIRSRDFIKWYYSEGVYGRATTGVLSRADLQANRQGYQFYRDLWSDPTKLPDICNYVGALWNEREEVNTYEPGLGTPKGPASTSMEAENP